MTTGSLAEGGPEKRQKPEAENSAIQRYLTRTRGLDLQFRLRL